MTNENGNKPAFLTRGTSACALFCGLVGVVIAVLLLTIGFWRTLMIAVFFAAGAFIGGVGDKKAFISEKAEKYFPQKELHPYKADDVKIRPAKAEAEEAPEADEDADEPPEELPEEPAAEEEPEKEEAPADGE